jgi:predicted RNase H-related nuclease YkuK (DUF458 family)
MKFKRLSDRNEVDLISYISHYIEMFPNVELLVGCDSQNVKMETVYASVIALYNPGKGAHVIYKKWRTPMERVCSVRLLNEVWYSVEIAEELRNGGLPKVKYIDIDLNPDPKYKSNEVFRQAVGLVEGMGYEVRYKSFGALVTYCADGLTKV